METFLKETEMSRLGPLADEMREDLGVGGALFRLELEERPGKEEKNIKLAIFFCLVAKLAIDHPGPPKIFNYPH